MFICLNQICGYTDLCHDVEKLRRVPYSSGDASHENRLMQVLKGNELEYSKESITRALNQKPLTVNYILIIKKLNT